MIIDCFPYFNEKEILELRIKLLYDHVDRFIITEGSHTHRGDKKEFTAKNVIDKLKISKEKIQLVHVYMPSYDEEKNPWVRERMQRDAAVNFINSDDVAFFSDCDEIINPKYIKYYETIVRNNKESILRVPLVYLSSSARYRVHDQYGNPIEWRAPFMCMKHHLEKYTPSEIRESYAFNLNNLIFPDIFAVDNGIIEDAGWHFSWMGGKEKNKIKEESCAHWKEIKVLENYHPKENSVDLLGRHDHILQIYDVSKLPKEVFEIENIRKFLFQE
jgi:beta-1,4-mannosyl-glycoprotein beta-1,4-N-acetylglucosaminyltransferase